MTRLLDYDKVALVLTLTESGMDDLNDFELDSVFKSIFLFLNR